MKLKMKTTATLLIAIFLISIFAVAIPLASAYEGEYAVDRYSSTMVWEATYATIQPAITGASSGDIIIVDAGIYDEQVVITESLTLEGAGDTTIIQPAGPELTTTASIPWIGSTTKAMSAIVSVETTGGTVNIKDLNIDGSLITSKSTLWLGGLVYLETSGTVEGVTVIGNPDLPDRTAGIFAAAITVTSSVEVTGCTVIGYNRAGIYALGGEFTANYHHNEINGPGSISTGVPNGMFFLEGAMGSAKYNIITDLGYTGVGEYRSTGIGTYNAAIDVIFSHNEISLVQNAFALSTDTIGTIVEYNDIHDCHTGVRIEARATDSIIQYNDIHDNDFAIRCGATMGDGNEAHYNDFINNLGLEWTNVDEDEPNTYVGAVCNLHTSYILDAENNWWGNPSGPGTVGPGSGDTVSTCVDYDPWLTRPCSVAKGGFDCWGYNYKARLFVGPADGVDRILDGMVWGDQTYANDHLVMKWSKGWDDARFHGGDWGPDAWETNEWNGMVPGGSGEVWHYKIIWVGPDLEASEYWREGGYAIWGQFEVIMSQGAFEGEHIWETQVSPNGFGGPYK